MENNLKQYLKKINYGLLALLLALGYFMFLIKNDIAKSKNLKNNEKQVANQIREQDELGKELSRRGRLLNDDMYIEKLARDKLGMIKQGESAYKVINK